QDFVMTVLPNPDAPRVLVADPDPDEMDRLEEILQSAGYAVTKAYNTGDALYALQHHSFHVVVLDARLAERNEYGLAMHMTRSGSLPWIALVEENHRAPQRLLDYGAAAIVQRPFTAGVLLRHVDNALRGQRMSLSGRPEMPADDTVRAAHDELNRLLAQRLTEQQTLSRLVRSLSAVLDLDTLLTQVVDAAVSLSHAEEGLLLLPDDEGQALLIRAAKGLDTETARNFRIKTQDSLAGQVYRSGQPVLVGDQGPQKIKTEYLVKSLLYVPLSIKGQIIGVLGVNNKFADRTFTQHDLELLQDLAAHAAIAIENARLYEESVQRTHELSILVEAGEAANSTLAIDRVLAIIARQLIAALGTGQCYIGEWSPGDEVLRWRAIHYRTLWRGTSGPEPGDGFRPALARALAARRPALGPLPASSKIPHASALLPQRYAAQGAIVVPLLTQDQPLGAVLLTRLQQPFTDEHLRAAQRELQHHTHDLLSAFADADARRHQSSLFSTAERMIASAGADWLEVALWNPALAQMTIALSCGGGIWLEEPKPQLKLESFPSLARVLNTQEPVSGVSSADLKRLAELVRGQSVLALPLTIRGTTAGLVLLVDTLTRREFTRREVELAEALVLQAANALENARLYRDLELSLQELHRTQSRLVQTARLSAMGELAAAVAHQINNPLTTILVDTELLLADLSPDHPDREGLEAVQRAGKRALEVVRRLLTMARQQTGEETPEPQDVNATIRNTLTLVESHIRQGRIALTVDLADDLPPVAAISGQLEDVWLNLLLNARDAVADRPDPHIGIITRYDPAGNGVEVVIWDNGSGIPPELQEQVFEPFFTTKPLGEGTGLGLHICKQVVRKCGGSINVQSAYNEGARFTIFLPAWGRQGNV
ncbi:MAG: GAF domain-containing protein, partial [Aggregatilineaceae bacterium]